MSTSTTTAASITLSGITDQARNLAQARNYLAGAVNQLNEAIEALKAEHMDQLRLHVEAAANEWSLLEAMIQAAPHLFVKPRTVSMHGIKFGVEKGAGKIEIEDPVRTVRLIKKHLPDQADVLIQTTEKPVKKALANLPAAQLKTLQISVEGVGDRVVIRPEDGAIDKLVKTLISAATEDTPE